MGYLHYGILYSNENEQNNMDESHKHVEIKLDFFIWNIKEYIMYNSCKSSPQTGKIYVVRSKINGTL